MRHGFLDHGNCHAQLKAPGDALPKPNEIIDWMGLRAFWNGYATRGARAKPVANLWSTGGQIAAELLDFGLLRNLQGIIDPGSKVANSAFQPGMTGQ